MVMRPMVGGLDPTSLAGPPQPACLRAIPTMVSTTSATVMSEVSITTAPSGTINGEAWRVESLVPRTQLCEDASLLLAGLIGSALRPDSGRASR